MVFTRNKLHFTQSIAYRACTRVTSKRCMDILLVFIFAPVLLPLLLTITCVLLLRGGQVFYSQIRVGQGGLPFRLWKFRTMEPNADSLLDEYLSNHPEQAQEWKDTMKLRNDPRVAKFGHLLRRSSLDELPQIWNVLLGEMSLVGPRPVLQDELVNKYRGSSSPYLACLPGLTGMWQVTGRNRLDYNQRIKLDTDYSVRQCVSLDLVILWRTLGVVLRGTGY